MLNKDTYPKLLMMDLNEIGRFIGETQYQVEMSELASKYSGVDLIELGTSKNLARDYRDILSYCEGELKELVAAYLTRWDVQNLKTILRGKYFGATREEIQEDLVPAGRLGDEALNALLALDTIPDVLEEARKRQGVSIPDEVMRAFDASKNLAPIEDYLDKWNYANLLEMVQPSSKPKRLLRAFIRREIDVANLRTLLRLKLEGMPADRIGIYLIPGGAELNLADLQRLAASESFNQMVDDLSKYSFYPGIKDSLERAKQSKSLTEVMLDLQNYLAKQSEKFSHMYPLSVLPVINYLIKKRIEVDNIRAIARGKQAGLEPDTIRKLLVM